MLTYQPIDDLTFQSLYSLLRGGMKLLNDLEKFLKPHGLSQGRFAILLTLLEADGDSINPSKLAESAGKSRPTVTKMVDRLLADGLVEKGKTIDDGRGIQLLLTAKGIDLINRLVPEYNKRLLYISEELSLKDKKNLISVIGKIDDRL